MRAHTNTDARRKGMLRAFYAGKRRLPHFDEEAFSALIRNATGGKDAPGDMSVAELGKALDAMRLAGFAPKADAQTAKMQGMVKALWLGMYESGIVAVKDGYEAYCKRICKRGLASLTVKQCQSVIESLKRWWEREAGQRDAAKLYGILSGAVTAATVCGCAVTEGTDAIQ